MHAPHPAPVQRAPCSCACAASGTLGCPDHQPLVRVCLARVALEYCCCLSVRPVQDEAVRLVLEEIHEHHAALDQLIRWALLLCFCRAAHGACQLGAFLAGAELHFRSPCRPWRQQGGMSGPEARVQQGAGH